MIACRAIQTAEREIQMDGGVMGLLMGAVRRVCSPVPPPGAAGIEVSLSELKEEARNPASGAAGTDEEDY